MRIGMSTMSVSRIWRALGLQPQRSDSFKLSPDPLLVDKVRDVVGSYLNPLHKAVVLCVEEKSQIQAWTIQFVLPMRGLDSWSCHTVDANAPEALDGRGYPAMRKSDTPRERITRDHRFSLDHNVLR